MRAFGTKKFVEKRFDFFEHHSNAAATKPEVLVGNASFYDKVTLFVENLDALKQLTEITERHNNFCLQHQVIYEKKIEFGWNKRWSNFLVNAEFCHILKLFP